MTIVRVGSTEKYSEGWDAAFGKKRARPATARKKATKKASKSDKGAKKRR